MNYFIEFAESFGLIIQDVVINGSIQRVPVDGGKRCNKDGAYCLYQNSNGFAGWVQNFKTGEYATYGDHQQQLSESEMTQRREKLQHELENNYNKTAKTANYLVSKIFAKAVNHPYLTKKQIKPHGSYIDKYGALIIPLRNITGSIRTFQRITPEGIKSFLKGGEYQGHFHQFGIIKNKVIICEGFATGASIFEATNIATISAMNSGNLKAVALKIRSKYGEKLQIVIAADNDEFVKDNPGVTFAIQAASACNGLLIIPHFIQKDKQYTDFNDLSINEGKNETKKQILFKDN